MKFAILLIGTACVAWVGSAVRDATRALKEYTTDRNHQGDEDEMFRLAAAHWRENAGVRMDKA